MTENILSRHQINKLTPSGKPLDQSIINFILEHKRRNPSYRHTHISMQTYQSYSIQQGLEAID